MPDAATAVARAHQLLDQTGAVKTGHFLLSSGLHSGKYCQCAALFEHPKVAAEMADMLVAALPASIEVDVVLAPALGGILWGYEVARALTSARGRPVRSYFAERQSGEPFALRRSFALNAGERVLLAEDVVTTGGSVMELMPLIEAAGAKAVAFAAVADRSKGKFQPPAPLFSLVKLDFETYDPASCPLCAAGTKAVKPGSRATAPAAAKA
jgi:orotate phosphoribosyltransferase